jgi:protein-L-isoaspartate(D-aspartate) O-methyltransferase
MSASGNGARPPVVDFDVARREMVAKQIRGRGIRSPRLLEAMASVPRHLFVPPEHSSGAYTDSPLPIGRGQTISQPFIVAAMTEALSLEGHERVLEVGAGSGYQAAVLSLLAREVIAVESQPALAKQARDRLARLGYANVQIHDGDGSLGWPPAAPYDAMVVTAAAPAVPPPLVEQLKEGGRLVVPVGPAQRQELLLILKHDGRTTRHSICDCLFVPLLGRYGWRQSGQESSAE